MPLLPSGEGQDEGNWCSLVAGIVLFFGAVTRARRCGRGAVRHRSQLKGKGRYFGGTGTSRGSFSLREKVRMRETRGTQSFFLPLTLALSRRAYHYPHLCDLEEAPFEQHEKRRKLSGSAEKMLSVSLPLLCVFLE